MSDKTEQPTPKRLRKAREEGDSGASTFAAQAVAFLVVVSLVPSAVAALATHTAEQLRTAIARAGEASPSVAVDPGALCGSVVAYALPLLAAAAITSAVVTLVQTGAAIATKKLGPKLDRLNVFEGVKQLFSTTRLFAVLRAAAGAAIVAWLVVQGLRAHAVDVARLAGRLPYVGLVAKEIIASIARDAALVGIAIAVVDVVVTRRQWQKRLMMTKDEVKREIKEGEGDPQLKAARERAHQEMLMSAAVANVKNATVVIVNPTHLACALRYDEKEGDEAPVVLAKGEGEIAERIVRAAHDYGVPVLRDVPLARALVELEIGEAIPEALYEAVAEILRELWDEQEQSPR